jgi:hypothetical protein
VAGADGGGEGEGEGGGPKLTAKVSAPAATDNVITLLDMPSDTHARSQTCGAGVEICGELEQILWPIGEQSVVINQRVRGSKP